jgi:hypothetical protein
MPKRHTIGRVLERENGMVHYESAPGTDCVTLCQRTDWLGTLGGEDTNAEVTCRPCQWIMNFCRNGKL